MSSEIVCSRGVPFLGSKAPSDGGGGGKLKMSFVRLARSSFSLILILVVIVNATKAVPTHEFINVAGEREVVMPLKSLYWPDFLGDVAHSDGNKRTATQPIRLCGRRLANTISELCRGTFVGFNRRSDPDMQDNAMMIDAPAVETLQVFDLSSGGIQPISVTSHFPTSPQGYHSQQLIRLRRNIIEECCMKPCSVNEMLRYCGGN